LRSPPPPEGIKPPTALYTVLNISRTASAADIKKAFRTMSLKWHPDRCSQADKYKATDKMAEINQAHDILSDEKKRAFYDKWGILPSSLNV
jgi:DnaJ-class molecular chaperone